MERGQISKRSSIVLFLFWWSCKMSKWQLLGYQTAVDQQAKCGGTIKGRKVVICGVIFGGEMTFQKTA
jgi:hypothetical protein